MGKFILPLMCSYLFYMGALAQPVNDFCEGAIVFDEEFIAIEQDCQDNGWRTVTASLEGAHPSPNLTGCVFPVANSVWYEIPVGNEAYLLSFKVTTGQGSEPALQLLKGDCSSFQMAAPCQVGMFGPVFLMDIEVEPNTSYFVVCGDATNTSDSIKLSWGKRAPEDKCVFTDKLEPIYRSGDQPIAGPYYPGDTVGFNYEVTFMVSTGVQNCQWMQGVVPVFGTGWDPGSFDSLGLPLNSKMNGNPYPAPNVTNSGQWDWWTNVRYHHPHCYLKSGDFDGNGSLDLCDARFDPDCTGQEIVGGCCGPCWNSSSAEDSGMGDLLPAGWFTSGVEGSCGAFLGWPSVDWGDGNTCNGMTGPWNFYFELVVPPSLGPTDTAGDFSIVMHSFADGETGAWTGGPSVCAGDYPSRFDAYVDVGCDSTAGMASISGKLFVDYDGDCIPDQNSPGLRFRVIQFKSLSVDTTTSVVTNSNGHYSAELDTGYYWIIPMVDGLESEICPDSTLVHLSEVCGQYQVDIPFDNELLCPEDLSWFISPRNLRVCDTSYWRILVYNEGVLEFNDPVIIVELDSFLILDSASVDFVHLGNNTYELHLPDISAGTGPVFYLRLITSCDAPVGYEHCVSATLQDPPCGLIPDSLSVCIPNGVAVDPNFKVDSKDFSLDKTRIIDIDEPIEYQVHFQNTGTSYAKSVTILDTLPAFLDVTSFMFMGSTHAVDISLEENRILRFFFEDIFLPDSTTNEPESHGAIVFRIKPDTGLQPGDRILNSASIYFDYSAPVVTNLKEHFLGCDSQVEIDSVEIASDHGSGNGSIQLFPADSSGYVFIWSNGGSGTSVTSLSAGEYSVTISDDLGCTKVLNFEVLLETGTHAQLGVDPEFRLFPVPARDMIYLKSDEAINGHIRIFSTQGREVYSGELSESTLYTVRIAGFPSGVYICSVLTEKGIRTRKFVIEGYR